MRVKHLHCDIDKKKYLQRLGVDGGGVGILAAKADLHLIAIEDLHVGAANILKQDALCVGADLAVPRGTVIAQRPRVDTLLIASKRSLLKLIKKERSQPFGLAELADVLAGIIAVQKPKKAAIMGVINANDDSFFEGSRFVERDAISAIEQMIEEGADIIDIGAVSSRPNAPKVCAQEEFARLEKIVATIAKEELFRAAAFSIDSYTPDVVSFALDHGFRIVNDITGLADDTICRIAAAYEAKVVLMHMQGTPQTMQNNPHYEDVVREVYSFFEERIAKAAAFGIEDVVLDVGIGFGKSLEHNLLLLRHLEDFLRLNKPLLVGASRKSLINALYPSSVEERLPGTLAVHLEAFRNGASILRVHDVAAHKQALAVQEALLEL